jgi:hypothetical protein
MDDPTTPPARSRLLVRWESLPARIQLATSFAVSFAGLLGIHLLAFPHLTFGRSAFYAVGEAAALALLLTAATQMEVARQRALSADAESVRTQRPDSDTD